MKYLLAKSHSYVLLGKIAIDLLERAFCKLRQSGGSTYFVNNLQALEKFSISKTKLMLRCDIDLSTFVTQDEHFCEKCSYSLLEEHSKVFNSLPLLEEHFPMT